MNSIPVFVGRLKLLKKGQDLGGGRPCEPNRHALPDGKVAEGHKVEPGLDLDVVVLAVVDADLDVVLAAVLNPPGPDDAIAFDIEDGLGSFEKLAAIVTGDIW